MSSKIKIIDKTTEFSNNSDLKLKLMHETRTEPEEETIINKFDFSIIEELDPICQLGYKPIFIIEDYINIIHKENSRKDLFTIRLSYKNTNKKSKLVYNQIKLEIYSENDIFFYFQMVIDKKEYETIEKLQNLKCNFGSFMLTFIKLIETSCLSSKKYVEGHEIQLLVKDDIEDIENNTSTLNNKKDYLEIEFLKVMSHKKISTLKLKLNQSDDSFIKKVVTYRFNSIKSKMTIIQDRVESIKDFIEKRNPILSEMILKEPARLTKEYVYSKIGNV